MRALCLVAAVLAGLAGCSFGGRFEGDRFACGAADPCPDGQGCVGGFCQGAADADGGGGGDGGSINGACGTVSLLVDDFDDGVSSPALPTWRDGDETLIGEDGGELRLQFTAANDDVWAGARSTLYYHMRGGEVRVEVPQAGAHYAVLEVRGRDEAKAQILVEDGTTLQATILNGPVGTREVNEVYDPVAHRVWRIREVDGQLLFETAADAASDDWHRVASMDVPFSDDLVQVILSGAGRTGDPAVRFAGLNTGVAAPAGYCPASDLVDDFATEPFDPNWSKWENAGCSAAEVDGSFQVGFAAAGSTWCGIDSMQLYALDAGPVVVAVAPPSELDSQVVVGVWAYQLGDQDIYAQMVRQDSAVVFRVEGPDGSGEDSVPYTDDDRYFRVRASDGGRVHGDTSSDGIEWTERFDQPAPFDLSAVQVTLEGGLVDGASAEGDTARILEVNPTGL